MIVENDNAQQHAARLVVVVVLIIGFIQTHRAIKRKYKDEIETNKANA